MIAAMPDVAPDLPEHALQGSWWMGGWSRIRGLPARLDPQWLRLLIVADLVFFALHGVYRLGLSQDLLLDLTRDRGYAEVFQYVKEFWIVLLLAGTAARSGDRLLWLWSALFVYVLCDDALRWHETMGAWISDHGQFVALLGTRARDYGELTFFSSVGSVVAGLLGVMLWRGRDKVTAAHLDLLLLFGLLVFFGVGIDWLHAIADSYGMRGTGLLEDGGEMIAMSLILAYAADLARRAPAG